MSQLFAQWNVLDYVITIMILLSLIHGFTRGFVRGVISLITWFAAICAAMLFAPHVSDALQTIIVSPKPRYVLSAIIIFVVVMVLGMIIGRLASGLARMMMLGFLDRVLGLVLGFVRGVLLVVIVLFAMQTFSSVAAVWVSHSVLSPYFQGIITYLHTLIPKNLWDTPSLMERVSDFARSATTAITSQFHR